MAATTLAALLLWGPRAIAQDDIPGLDLTGDSKPAEPKKDDTGLDLTGDTTKPAEPAATPPAADDAARAPVAPKAPASEHDITQYDRVKSVQRKLYMKRGRFELSPSVVLNINDPYFTKVGGAVRAAFYPADSLALAARFTLLSTQKTDDVLTAKRNFYASISYSVPQWALMADVEWSPFYGKVAIFNSILQFDGYLVAGGGVVHTATSGTPLLGAENQGARGVAPGFDLGVGLRFITKDWLAVNVGLINTTYSDVPSGTTKGATQNLMMLHAGLSLFFPLKSTYREAE